MKCDFNYYEQPDHRKALIGRFAEAQRQSIRRLAEIGCDGVMGCDDWGLEDRMMVGMDLISGAMYEITLRRLSAVNPYQGEFYDPVEMHRTCRDAGVMIWQWTTWLAPGQREQIPTGFTLSQWVGDVAAGKWLMEAQG